MHILIQHTAFLLRVAKILGRSRRRIICDSSVSAVTLSVGWKTEELLYNFGAGQIFLCSPQHPARHWDLLNGNMGGCFGDQVVKREAIHAPPSITEIKNASSEISTPRQISKTRG
jgi:hypothetical protein